MEWAEGKLGLSDTIGKAATATDGQGELGWIYGGYQCSSTERR